MNKFKELIDGEKPTLVDFFAKWCGPCKMMHTVLENLKKEVGDQAAIVKVDVDAEANRALAAQYQVRSIPTLIIFKEGKAVWQHVGATDLETLKQALLTAAGL